LLQGKQ
jgi:hypothetical protein